MESYRILYRIRIGHDYFDGKPCPALQCRLTPQGEALAHRRGLLFRQTAPGEWTLLFRQEPDTKNDVLPLDLFVADPKFTLYTAWDGFQPSAAYSLELPMAEETVEAATAIRPTGKKRAIGSGFCTLSLRLTPRMVEAADSGQPMQTVLHFNVAAAQWEYLFIPNGEDSVQPGPLHDTITVSVSPEHHVLVVKGYSGSEYQPILGFLNVGDSHSAEPWLYQECLRENIRARVEAYYKEQEHK
ncbi:hypothetical protein QVN97_02110 [Bacteroides caecigallinarum]|nr:hypothetical protein [Bacteroides caecigallinarum]